MASTPSVALFATCLVDMIRPQVGFASAKLIQDSGFEVEVPRTQTCCGQPLVSGGDVRGARRLARRFIKTFSSYDYVVMPSGSCAATIKFRYGELFDDPKQRREAESLGERCYELTDFLTNVADCPVNARYSGICAYHDSCSGLRELGIRSQPRELLSRVSGLTIRDLPDPAACCGFGGAFCVKYPEIASTIASDKADDVERTDASTLLGGDLGCLMNIAGTLRRRGNNIRIMHVAEVLAGCGDDSGLGEPSK